MNRSTSCSAGSWRVPKTSNGERQPIPLASQGSRWNVLLGQPSNNSPRPFLTANLEMAAVRSTRQAGGDVVRTAGRSPNHGTLSGLTLEQASRLFTQLIPRAVHSCVAHSATATAIILTRSVSEDSGGRPSDLLICDPSRLRGVRVIR